MRARYTPEELIKIRQSPLVCRPAALPPTEEWMGPPAEQQSQHRRHNDNRNKGEGSFGNEGHTRPSILDMRHASKGSSNLPSDIVLGPPKTAFASSGALKSPRAFDSPGRSAFGNFSSDSPRNEYFGRPKYDGDKEASRFSARQNREGDAWGSRRDHEEQRGQADRDSGEELEPRNTRRQYRQGEWNNDGRRNGPGRENKQAWPKDDETFGITKVTKEEKDMNIASIRSRAWRDNDRAPRKTHDRDWDRQQNFEGSPEWMATDEPEQKKERHTAQDIEAWKAQMKAQSRGEQLTEQPSHARTDSGSLTSKTKPDKPLTFDKNMDSFFNLWDKPQTTPAEQTSTNEETMRAQQAKLGKASRFTGFFGPSAPVTPASAVPPPGATSSSQQLSSAAMDGPMQSLPTAEESALRTYNNLFDENAGGNDDKAGFDRMLLMLRSSAPVVDIGTPQLPLNAAQSKERAPADAPSSPIILSPRSQKKHGLEGILGQPKQPEPPRGVINKDTEFLLNLLRKDEGWQQHFPGMQQHKGVGLPPGGPKEEQFFNGRQHQDRHGVDKLNPNVSNMRPPHSRAFDNPHDEYPHPLSFNDSHGIPGPPGFDQHMPPGFPGVNRGGMHPPPGFPNRNQAMFPPGLGPAMGNLNLGGPDRGPPPFMGSGMPGFMPNHGPPPFPPQFPMMGPGHLPGVNVSMQGRPPLMDVFGPEMARDNENKNSGTSQQPQLHSNMPPGFQRPE